MYKVYGDILSGNCYKIKLLMRFLGIEHQWLHVDILSAETYEDSFTLMNPNGKIPALELTDGCYLWESNAMLHYLAEGTKYLPNQAMLSRR